MIIQQGSRSGSRNNMHLKQKTMGIVGLFLIANFVGFLNLTSETAKATDVSGTISTDTTWDLAGSPYIVTGSVNVAGGATLTIDPGVEVKFNGVYTLYVDGFLNAVGTASNRITMTSNLMPSLAHDWEGITVNSTGHVKIEYCDITYSNTGILLQSSSNNIIMNNSFHWNTMTGVYLFGSSNYNNVTNNNLSSNNNYGIFLYQSSFNNITNNIVSNNDIIGIGLSSSNRNTITNNNVSSNSLTGIALLSSGLNKIYHNNFIDNPVFQASDDSSTNFWNDSYPSGGNYWSDFDETSEGAYDDYQGLDQNVSGSDGIVDNGSGAGGGKNPYIIDSDSIDFYPVLEPFGPLPPSDMISPEAITDLAAGNPAETTINLTWTAPGDDGGSGLAQGYILKYSTSGPIIEANWSSASTYTQSWVPQGAGNTESQMISGLSSDTRYWFAIKAFDEVPNFGAISNSPDETTLASMLTVPGPLSYLIRISGNSYVNLGWDPPASDGGSSITGYNIYRDETLIGSVGPSQLWYNDTGLVNGVTYSYNISAMNAVGEGLRSSISATPRTIPSAPLNLQATAGDSYVNLIWAAPSSNGGSQVTNYAIYRGTSSGEETFLTEIGTVLNYNDTTVTNDVTYYYKVKAKNTVGEGPLSAGASATPKGPEVNVPEDEDQPIWLLWLLILIVIIVLIILLILFKRRKGGEGLPPQEPPQEESLGNESEMPRGQEI